jgi:hypothetical protein
LSASPRPPHREFVAGARGMPEALSTILAISPVVDVLKK